MKCPECNGTGVYDTGMLTREPCRACAGLGERPSTHAVVQVPDSPYFHQGHVPQAGGRHTCVYNIARSFAKAKVEKDLASSQIHEWCKASLTGLPDYEIDRCIDNAYQIEAIHTKIGLTRYPTARETATDLRSLAAWITSAALLPAGQVCSYAIVSSLTQQQGLMSATLNINLKNIDGQNLQQALVRLAMKGEIYHAVFESPGETCWVRVQLEWWAHGEKADTSSDHLS